MGELTPEEVCLGEEPEEEASLVAIKKSYFQALLNKLHLVTLQAMTLSLKAPEEMLLPTRQMFMEMPLGPRRMQLPEKNCRCSQQSQTRPGQDKLHDSADDAEKGVALGFCLLRGVAMVLSASGTLCILPSVIWSALLLSMAHFVSAAT